MKLIKNPEINGILTLLLIIAILGGIMLVASGKLEQWFGIALFSGSRALDKIVYLSDAGGSTDIYSVNPDGSNQTRLTHNASPLSAPAVSTLGNKIIFVGNAGASNQIFGVGGGGGTPRQLTTATGPKSLPQYSPDGKRISFIAGGKVYVAELNGGQLEPVLPTDEEIRQAMTAVMDRGSMPAYKMYAWGPVGYGIAGVSSSQDTGDVFTYLSDLRGQPIKVPISAQLGKEARIERIAWAANAPVILICVSSPKCGWLLAFDAEQKSIRLLMPAIQKATFTEAIISPDGNDLIIADRLSVQKSGLIKIDLRVKQLACQQAFPAIEGAFSNISFSPAGDKVLATQTTPDGKSDIVTIDHSNGQVTKLTSDGQSHDAVWTPISKK